MQDFSLARRAMIDNQLRPQGVTDRAVLAAMARVERERFVPNESRAFAYFDRPMVIAEGRSLMSPPAIGRLLSEAKPRAGQKALIVGSGTGYSAALLREIGLDVIALEVNAGLAAAAEAAGIPTVTGNPADGWPKGAPYDIILVEGAVQVIPPALAKQLAADGVLAGAILDRGVTRLIIGRCSNDSLGLRSIADTDVDPLPGFERPRAFTF